jgi:hypothetical protein
MLRSENKLSWRFASLKGIGGRLRHYNLLDKIYEWLNVIKKFRWGIRRISMKKLILLIMVALWLTVNVTAITWGGVNLDKWQVFGTEPEKPK